MATYDFARIANRIQLGLYLDNRIGLTTRLHISYGCTLFSFTIPLPYAIAFGQRALTQHARQG